jgi:hypothetical protein
LQDSESCKEWKEEEETINRDFLFTGSSEVKTPKEINEQLLSEQEGKRNSSIKDTYLI